MGAATSLTDCALGGWLLDPGRAIGAASAVWINLEIDTLRLGTRVNCGRAEEGV